MKKRIQLFVLMGVLAALIMGASVVSAGEGQAQAGSEMITFVGHGYASPFPSIGNWKDGAEKCAELNLRHDIIRWYYNSGHAKRRPLPIGKEKFKAFPFGDRVVRKFEKGVATCTLKVGREEIIEFIEKNLEREE